MKPQRKKLIEVALPLEAINVASAREKSIRHGHPSTLHLWWARRPLAAARAIIFAQMVDDPSSWPDLFKDEKAQEKERQRLFRIIEDLVQWENTTNEEVLQRARDEIWRSWRRACAEDVDHPRAKELYDRDKLPGFLDPFAGGGALPLEAQRLGLEAYASDLNPVAVLINKAMIEIPPRFAAMPPINPDAREKIHLTTWKGAEGLADDVRFYGRWIQSEAEKRIGHLYPKIEVTAQMANERPDLKTHIGKKFEVVAWIWARTVKSPNPAYREVDVPLISSFWLCTKPGKEAWIEPILHASSFEFTVRSGVPSDTAATDAGTKLGRGANFRCILSGSPIEASYIRSEAQAGRMGSRLLAVVADGTNGRLYCPPNEHHDTVARSAVPDWKPEQKVTTPCHDVDRLPMYGMAEWGDAFTSRQLVALTTLVGLISEVQSQVKIDALQAGLEEAGPLREGSSGAQAYAEAVSVYMALALGRLADLSSTIATWIPGLQAVRGTFGRQAIPMTWDYCECNPVTDKWQGGVDWVARCLPLFPSSIPAHVRQADAARAESPVKAVISTDPPYYDNIGYADLSDYFYVWMRQSLKQIEPSLFGTILVPKSEELIAARHRHGSKAAAESFFLEGMTQAMHRLAENAHPGYPVTIYYAFKQSESDDDEGTVSTGWETFLDAVIRAGFALTGTWPVRTERPGKITAHTNILASSIVLVCRPREATAPTATRRELLTALQKELPIAIANLQRGNVAPVDLQQAAIGPGMAIFTRYAKVVDADGKIVSVRDALAMINQALDEVLAKQEGDFDGDTRWALTWFEQFGFAEGEYGVAETLAIARNTSVQGIVDAGIGVSGRGKVRLLKPDELPTNWTPEGDKRLTVWDMVHHLIRILDQGEAPAAELLARLGTKAEVARELAYRLYSICNRTKRSQDAQRYNALVQSWPEIAQIAQQIPKQTRESQQTFEGMN